MKSICVTFKSSDYHEVWGTIMGTKVAHTYTILVTGFRVWNVHCQSLLILVTLSMHNSETIGKDFWLIASFYGRKKNIENLTELKNAITNHSNNIRFTLQFNLRKLAFLDILTKKQDEKIKTDSFYKPANLVLSFHTSLPEIHQTQHSLQPGESNLYHSISDIQSRTRTRRFKGHKDAKSLPA